MNFIKSLFKSVIIAFSTYSKVPMPGFIWKEEDMKYHLGAFPLVGLVIGILTVLWDMFSTKMELVSCSDAVMQIAIPIIVTGGLHLDGFMDTMDARKSYKSREEKLKILSDPHTGAFAIISLVLYFMLYFVAVGNIERIPVVMCMAACFVASRAACGIIILKMPKAKNNGMLVDETENAGKRVVIPILAAELLAAVCFMMYCSPYYGAAVIIGEVIFFMWYRSMIMNEFGGISGDLAGYYVCMFELVAVIMLGITSVAGF